MSVVVKPTEVTFILDCTSKLCSRFQLSIIKKIIDTYDFLDIPMPGLQRTEIGRKAAFLCCLYISFCFGWRRWNLYFMVIFGLRRSALRYCSTWSGVRSMLCNVPLDCFHELKQGYIVSPLERILGKIINS